MSRKKRFLHHYLELFVILFAVAVLGFLAGGPQGIDQTLTANAAVCPILDGGTGDDDAVVNGVITISSSKTFTAITGTYDCTATAFLITGSGSLVLDGNPSTGQIAQVSFGSLTINIGGVLSSNFEGCAAGNNYVIAPNGSNVCAADSSVTTFGNGAGGAGYGGAGGAGSTNPGRGTYGSALSPVLFGSAGASTNQGVAIGGDGGGVVRITVTGTLTNNGVISADGETGLVNGANAAGGGSGGSIYVTAGTINGAGSFSAKGGNGADSTNDGGGGGGGRISVNYGGGAFAFDASDFIVSGGSVTGSATAGTKGTVYLKNTATSAVSVFHGFSFDNTNHFVSSWTVDPSATNQYCESGASTPAVHATGAISFAGTLNCTTSITSFTLEAATTLSFANSSSLSVNGAGFYSASTNFSVGTGVTIASTKVNSDVEFNVPTGNAQTWDGLTLNVAAEAEFIMDDAFALTLTNGTAINASVRWTALTALTENSGTSISANFRGCTASTNYSSVPNSSNVCATDSGFAVYGNGAGGTGHGGTGGPGSTSTNRGVYDSAIAPVLIGTSGGSTNQSITNGGDGGGIVRVVVSGTFTHNGAVSADGEAGLTNGTTAAGGGAGGSVYITAGAINGTTGTYSARGGNGADSTNDGGGGGGGRIAVYHAAGSYAFDAGDFNVNGGTATGTATAGTKGTVYVKDTATNAVTVFHGFSFDNTNHYVSSWTVDPTAANQYCESSASTPSIHATGAITLAGTLNCSSAITSFTADATSTLTIANSSSITINGGMFLGGASLSMGTGVTIANTRANFDIQLDIGDGSSTTWDSLTLTVASEGELITDDNFSLTLQNGTAINGSVRWSNLASLTQNSGTTINANFKGCAASTNYINAPNSSNVCANDTSQAWYGNGAGGSGHGGAGGAGTTSPGRSVIDSSMVPVLFGPSGGSTNQSLSNGGDGGGVVRISVSGTFTHNGTISADGGNGLANGTTGAGGAAGGSIYVTAAALNGTTGTYSAKGGNGGDGSSNDGGGGGGGRISVSHAGGAFVFDSTDFNVNGGTVTGAATAGAKGTVYVKDTATEAVTLFHGFGFDDTDHFVSSWTIDPSATNVYCESSASTPSVHATGAITLGGTTNCTTSISSLTLDANTVFTFSNSASISVNGSTYYSAGTNFSMGTGVVIATTQTNSDIEFNIPIGNTQTWDSLTVTVAREGELITDDNFSLTLQNGTAINGSVRWSNLADLTQNSGTSINASFRGCAATTVYSNVPNASNVCATDSGTAVYGNGAGGAGHGGAGGAGSTSVGRGTYDSSTAPVLFGASGGSTNQSIANGGDGGGVVRIVVAGTLTHNGTITAEGENGLPNGTTAAGGGAGGSIYVTAGTYTCSAGTFSAKGGNGGDGSANDGGGGGGGRFRVEYGSDTSIGCPLSGLTAASVVPGGTVTGTATAGSTGSLSVVTPVPTPGACPFVDNDGGDNDATVGVYEWAANQTFTASSSVYDCTAPATFRIAAGRTITLDGNSASGAYAQVSFTNLVIDATGKLSADAEGCAAGTNHVRIPNTSTNVCGDHSGTTYGSGGSGGGHGGAGGLGSTVPTFGSSYDSATAPVLFGSSGASSNQGVIMGGSGGGVVRITVNGTLTNNGAISANGNNGGSFSTNAGGGGAGGSIYVNAGTIAGTTGTFETKGGNGFNNTNDGGGGGGGRIAVYYNATGSTFAFTSTNLVVTAGTATGTAVAGTNGTVFIDDDKGSKLTLIDDDVTVFHGFTFTDTDYFLNSWTADASATNQHCDPNISSGATPSISATTVTLAGTVNCTQTISSFTYAAVGTLTLSNSSTMTLNAALNLSADSSFSVGTGVTVTQNKADADINFNIPNGNDQTWSGFTVNGPAAGDLVIDDTIAITLASGSALNASLRFSNLTAFTQNSGTSIDASGKGCAGGANHVKIPNGSNVCADHSGTTYATGASGGGHGGVGGRGSVAPTSGSTYDSATAPILYGSSGGGTNVGTNGVHGGGLVRIDATGAIALNGTIAANGLPGVIAGANATGGSAGGSVYISTTGALSGSIATIFAKGGDGAVSTQKGGGGGGGRISLVYGSTSLSLASGLFDVSAGTASSPAIAGTKGTAYVDDTANTPNGSEDDIIRIYHGFTFADADLYVNSWLVDATASNQYCDASSGSPSVSAGTISLDGTMNCSSVSSLSYVATGALSLAASASTTVGGAQSLSAGTVLTIGNGSSITSTGALTLTAGTSFAMGTGVTVTDNGTDSDINFNIPNGNDQTWSGLTVNGPASGDLVIDDVIAVTLSSSTAINASLRFTNLTSFTQNSGTSINANGKGCAGGPNHLKIPNGSNVCADHSGTTYGTGASGGGHGGVGGRGSVAITSGSTYDSASAPVLYGSSGGSTNVGDTGVAGGGLVRINATGTVALNGTITANGLPGFISGANATGGGAGGSVYISTTGALSGSIATIFATGGDGATSTQKGGGGGGGRISLVYASTSLSLASGLFDVSAGTASSPAIAGTKGTVYADETGVNRFMPNDDVIRVYHGFTYTDYDWIVTSWIIDPTAAQSCDTTMSSGATPSVTATNAITFNGSLNCTPTITSFIWSSPAGFIASASTSMTIVGALTMTTTSALSIGNSVTLTSSGTTLLSAGTSFSLGTGVTITNGGTNTDIEFNVPAGNNQTWSGLTVNGPREGDLYTDDAIAITLSSGTALNANVRFTNLTAFTQDAGTSIDADFKGCSGTSNHVNAANSSNVCTTGSPGGGGYGNGASGGSYGGGGGAGTSTVATNGTYGSATAPDRYGASGGGGNSVPTGPAGGGLVRINASGSIVLGGTITANGEAGSISGSLAAGGGSGGSIYASTLGSLTGSIASLSAIGASGGNSTNDGGGGSGGRISLVYGSTTLPLAAGFFDVSGGAGPDAAADGTKGTAYAQDTSNTVATTTDDIIRIYHGFTYADTDANVAQWIIDATATNQYCDTGFGSGATPSVTAANAITFKGTLNCNPGLTFTSFTWTSTGGFTFDPGTSMTSRSNLLINPPTGSITLGASATVSSNVSGTAGGTLTLNSPAALTIGNSSIVKSFGAMLLSATSTFSMGSGVTVTDDGTNTDITFNIPASDDQTWSGLTVNGPREGDLVIDDAIAVTLSSSTALNANLRFINLTAFTQDLGTSVNANAKGCSGTSNNVNAPNSSNVCTTGSPGGGGYGVGASGGSYGGGGGAGTSTVATNGTYGSATAPDRYGASGGGGNSVPTGPAGGGLVRISASGAVTLNGAISANGEAGTTSGSASAGGGSGGTIYVTAGSLGGTPSAAYSAIGASGGNSTNDGGGGSGGRMAFVYSSTSQSINAGAFDVSGGAGPDAAADGTKGTVFVNNIAANSVQIFHGFTYANIDFNVATWSIDTSATNQYCDTTSGATPSITATNAITFNGTLNCGTTTTSFAWTAPGFSTAASTSMTYSGALTVTSTGVLSLGNSSSITSNGAMLLSAGTAFSAGSGVTITDNTLNTDITFNIAAGDNQTWSGLTVNIPREGDLVVDDAVDITLSSGTALNGNVKLTNLTNFTQDSGTSIIANLKGCSATTNNINAANASNVCTTGSPGGGGFGAGAAGGSYGGAGGTSSTGVTPNATYGSAAAPDRYGASGGGGNSTPIGAHAGGLIRIIASGTVTHNGTLAANGDNGTISGSNAAGGGSGGSIYVSATTYSCSTGTFSAAGGNGGDSTNDGGGGGGGRVAISYQTDSSGACPLSGLTAAGVAPGGVGPGTATDGATGSLSLNAGNPIPAITTISPNSKNVNDSGFTLTVNGSNFVSGAVVRFNGSNRTTTFVNATQVTASILASDLTTVGSYPITVFNASPAGGESNAVNLTVNNPVPTTTSISPNNKNVNDGAFTMTVNGTNFVSTSVVRFDGSDRTTTFVNSSQLTASIPASDMLVGGNFNITVFNPSPGGGTSNAQTFTVGNPIPTTTSISPTSKFKYDAEFTLTVNGTNFVPSSVVRFAGSDRVTTYVGATQVTAIIPATDLTAVGNFAITVFNPTPGGGTSNAQTFTVQNPVPTTTSISPTSKNAGDAGFTLTVNGTNFVTASVVRFNGADRTTTFVNENQLTASISTGDIATGAEHTITVFNPTPGGGTSNGQTFTVNNLLPTTTSISPSTRTANSGAFTLTVNGTNFVSTSIVRFAGSDRSTNFVNSTQVTASIPNSDIAVNGTYAITVFSPTPGGGESNSQTLTVQNPVPAISNISPTHADQGSAGFTLTVNGSNFMTTSVVRFAGSDRTTTYVSASQLTADIPDTDLTTGGTFAITVFNPSPGGGTSNSVNFIVGNPVPVTTSISPTSKTLNDAGFTLTVNGSDFMSTSVVRFNGSNRTTTFVNDTQLTASIPGSDLTTAGTFTITVFNPAPVGGTSNGQTFTVNNPVPTTSSISPNSKNVGDIGFTMTINGTNFLSSSVVRLDGNNRTTTFVNSTQLTASIPASDMNAAGTFTVTVFNPTPGGGTSNGQTFTVNNLGPTTSSIAPTSKPAGSATFTLTVNGNNFVSNSVVRFDGSDRTTTFIAATQLTASIPSSDLVTPGVYPITVFSPGPGGGTSNAQNFTVGGGTQDATLQNSITLSRLKAGVTATVTVRYTLQNELSGTLTVTFPVGFTVTAAANSGASSGCLSGFGFTSSTLTATKTNCSGPITLGGATVTNPSTPGIYHISWVNDDPGGGDVIIVDSDQVSVSSSVDPALSFNVGSQASATACDGTFGASGGTLGLGALDTASVASSDVASVPHLCTRVSTNAGAGAVVTVVSANVALTSVSTPSDSIPSSSATLTAGTTGYGLCAGSGGGDSGKDATVPVGATPAAASPFNGSCSTSAHAVGGLTASPQTVWSVSGPVQNGFFRLYVKAAISPSVPAHTDYTDVLTFIATGTY